MAASSVDKFNYFLCIARKKVIGMKYKVKDYADIKANVEKMDIEELLCCVICPDFNLQHQVPVKNTTSLMFHPYGMEEAKVASEKLNADRRERALVIADLEHGAGEVIYGAVEFPSMRAAMEAGDEQLAYDMGKYTAKEARLAGYHWTFGPCVDILGNTRNPIVSNRTAGEDADSVIRYGGAYMRGIQDAGMIATLKHFPGDGYCDDDQHITTPSNPLSREEWDETFGKVYRTLIEDGAMAIMPGHIALPAYDEIDEETGLYPPATVSRRLLTGLLREQLGFEGIIISDAVIMGGFCGYQNYYRASARFLEAGGDSLLFMHPTNEYFEEMKKLISEGVLSMETLKNRAYRMLCFSREYFEKEEAPIKFDRKRAEECSKTMVKKSVKIVRDRINLLPLDTKQVKNIAHVILANPGMPEKTVQAAKDLTTQLTAMGLDVDEHVDPGCGAIRNMAKSGKYEVIICSIVNERRPGFNSIKLSGPIARNMMAGWMRYDTPAVFISYHDPYFESDFCASTDTVINTYGYCEYTNPYVIQTLFE